MIRDYVICALLCSRALCLPTSIVFSYDPEITWFSTLIGSKYLFAAFLYVCTYDFDLHIVIVVPTFLIVCIHDSAYSFVIIIVIINLYNYKITLVFSYKIGA